MNNKTKTDFLISALEDPEKFLDECDSIKYGLSPETLAVMQIPNLEGAQFKKGNLSLTLFLTIHAYKKLSVEDNKDNSILNMQEIVNENAIKALTFLMDTARNLSKNVQGPAIEEKSPYDIIDDILKDVLGAIIDAYKAKTSKDTYKVDPLETLYTLLSNVQPNHPPCVISACSIENTTDNKTVSLKETLSRIRFPLAIGDQPSADLTFDYNLESALEIIKFRVTWPEENIMLDKDISDLASHFDEWPHHEIMNAVHLFSEWLYLKNRSLKKSGN